MQAGILAWVLLVLGVLGLVLAVVVGGAASAMLGVLAVCFLLGGVLSATTE